MGSDPDLTSLEGRRVIVTGSTRGLGRSFVRELAACGASVVVNGRDGAACRQLADEIDPAGRRSLAVPGSVADETVAEALVEGCAERFGGVDLIVNNAGLTRDRTLMKMTVDDFDDVIAVHLRGSWLVSRAAARVMAGQGGGAILNVVSGSALFGLVGQSNYAAAKGGLLGLTRALSVELAPRSISVNALYPVALTDMTRPVAEARGSARVPFGDPADVAPVVGFLASGAAEGLTGQVIHFDGRTLALWTHPDQAWAVEGEQPWTSAEIAECIRNHRPEKLHPDRWGTRARRP